VLPHAWLALICGVAGIDIPLAEPAPAPAWLGVDRSLGDMKVVINEVKNHLRGHWRCLG
jgi:hypothetical protein